MCAHSDSLFSVPGLPPVVPFFLAPLAGYTNLAFRLLVKRLGAGLAWTEMVSVNGLWYEDRRSLELLQLDEAEQPVGVQLFGTEPERFVKAARLAFERGAACLDVNAGCSVPKVRRTGAGSALLYSPERLAELVEALRQATPLPVSVKIRLGPEPDNYNAPEVLRCLQQARVSFVTVHGRFAGEKYDVPARQELVAELAKAFPNLPLVANGDFHEAQQMVAFLRATSVKAIMVGRAALSNPWLFAQAKALLEGAPLPPPASWEERKAFMLELAHALAELGGERFAALNMRKFVCSLTKGVPHGADLRRQLSTLTSLAQLERMLG